MGGLFSVALSAGLPAWALPSTLPCGVRTFLDVSAAAARPTPRIKYTGARYPRREVRRLVPLLLLVSIACGPPATTAEDEGEGEPLPGGVGLEAGAVVETARAFLEAYAEPRTLTATHARLVAGADLLDWVHWADVQNAGIDFVRGGSVQIRDLRVVDFTLPLAAVAVDAIVETRFRNGEDVAERERRFGALLLQRFESGWKVVDAVQDARQMSTAITVFEPPVEVASDAAAAEIQSVFRFTGGTVVNLRIGNRGGAPLAVDLERSLLLVGDERLPGRQITTSLIRPIEPGRLVEGGLTFPTVEPDAVPDAVLLRVRGSAEDDLLLELPAEAFLLEEAGQSGSNSGGTGASGM